MKKIFSYIGLLVIMVFSFYYTDKIVLITQKKNPIMKKIEQVSKNDNEKYVNAIIEDDKIIPGKNGISINESKSFSNMRYFGTYNEYYLVYDQKKPKISLDNNKDKVIIQGNPLNNSISIITEYDENIISYLESNKIKANVLINKDNYMNINTLEHINDDFENYNEVEFILNRAKLNKNICYIHDNNKIFCVKRKKYLIKTNLVLENDNVFDIKNNLIKGSIIFIKKDTSINNINIILNYIKFKGINIVYLSTLISEENNKS